MNAKERTVIIIAKKKSSSGLGHLVWWLKMWEMRICQRQQQCRKWNQNQAKGNSSETEMSSWNGLQNQIEKSNWSKWKNWNRTFSSDQHFLSNHSYLYRWFNCKSARIVVCFEIKNCNHFLSILTDYLNTNKMSNSKKNASKKFISRGSLIFIFHPETSTSTDFETVTVFVASHHGN